jgi:hypothetical protein
VTQSQTKHRSFESPSRAPEEYVGYEVLDPLGRKIGRAEKLFFNRNGGPEYVRVRIGVLFARHVFIPVQDVAFDGASRSLTLK